MQRDIRNGYLYQLCFISGLSDIAADSHVSSTVELESGLETDDALDIALSVQLAEGFLGSVETVDVSLVVLGVVERHDLG